MGHPVTYSGWRRGATGAVDLTPIPPVHALVAQIHPASKSAPGQWPGLASAGPQADVSRDALRLSEAVSKPVSLVLWFDEC